MIAEDPYYMVITPSNTFKMCLVGRQLAKWKHQLFFLIDFNFRCSIEFHQCFDRSRRHGCGAWHGKCFCWERRNVRGRGDLAHKYISPSQTEAGGRSPTKIFNIPTPLLCYSWVRALGLRWKGNFHIINQNLDCLGACCGRRTEPRHNVHGNIFNGTWRWTFFFLNPKLVLG